MLQMIEISEIVDSVLKLEKKLEWGDMPYSERKKSPVEYYPGYWMAVNAMDEIRTHAVRGVYPGRLIEHRAPNMTDQERKYIENNFKQITLPVFIDWCNTIKRAYADNNWSLEFTDDQGDEGGFRWYCERGIASTSIRMSLEDYQKNIITATKTIDAMGCLAMKPEKQKVEIVDGEPVIASERLDPIPQYYECSRLHAFEEGSWYLFLTHEKSDVYVGNRIEKTGFIYELYDRNAIYRIVQIGAKKDNNYTVEEYYRHDRDDCPVQRLKGFADYLNGKIVWISPYSYAVPVLDEAIIDANMLRGVKATSVFPYRVMVGNICEYKMTIGEQIECCDGRGYFNDFDNNRTITCKGCGGDGLRDRISPQGVMLLRPESPGEQSELKASQPAMYFVAPGVEIPKFIREEIEKYIREAKRIMHIRDSNSEVNGSEDMTATGMVIDEKALYSFIKPVIDQDFSLLDFQLKWIGIIGFGDIQPYVLTSPITFDFKTEYDYLMEISMAIKNGLPPFVVHTIILKYLKTLFYNQLESASAFNIIVKSDRLLTMDDDEVNIKLSKGLISDWEVILHDSAVSFIMELQDENPGFFEMEESAQIEMLIKKAKEKAAETKASNPMSPTNLVDMFADSSDTNLRPRLPQQIPPTAEPGQSDLLGKLPLALQQIALARQRAIEAGDTALASQLGTKMKELTKEL